MYAIWCDWCVHILTYVHFIKLFSAIFFFIILCACKNIHILNAWYVYLSHANGFAQPMFQRKHNIFYSQVGSNLIAISSSRWHWLNHSKITELTSNWFNWPKKWLIHRINSESSLSHFLVNSVFYDWLSQCHWLDFYSLKSNSYIMIYYISIIDISMSAWFRIRFEYCSQSSK